MRLSSLEVGERSGWYRISVVLTWEDLDRPSERLWFEVRPADVGVAPPCWEPFAVAAYPLALSSEEGRLSIEGRLCPRLADGLSELGGMLGVERGGPAPPRLEPTGGRVAPVPGPEAASGAFLSGGVDSLAMIRENQLTYAPEHPGRIRSGITIFGLNTFDIEGGDPVVEREAAFTEHLARLERFGFAIGIDVLPVRTNVRSLYADFDTWGAVGVAAGTVACGLSVPGVVRELWLGSDGVPPGARRLNRVQSYVHLLSTAGVEVHLGQPAMTRLRKTEIVADWPEARSILKSCVWYRLPPPGGVNCGTCEKCVRTMLALLALGRLHLFDTFDRHDLAPEDLSVLEDNVGSATFYAECLTPLRRLGRHDLADALEVILDRKMRAEAAERRGGIAHVFASLFRRSSMT